MERQIRIDGSSSGFVANPMAAIVSAASAATSVDSHRAWWLDVQERLGSPLADEA